MPPDLFQLYLLMIFSIIFAIRYSIFDQIKLDKNQLQAEKKQISSVIYSN